MTSPTQTLYFWHAVNDDARGYWMIQREQTKQGDYMAGDSDKKTPVIHRFSFLGNEYSRSSNAKVIPSHG